MFGQRDTIDGDYFSYLFFHPEFPILSMSFFKFFFFYIYLFLRDRVRQSENGGEAEREEDTGSEAGSRL